jgi:hypothetical protein
VVVAVGFTLTAIPLVTARLPGVITPVPPEKSAVRLELPPAVIVAGFAVKLVIVAPLGGGWDVNAEPPQPTMLPMPRPTARALTANERFRFTVIPERFNL